RPPSARIAINAVKRFDVVGFLVARLALGIVALAVGLRRGDQGFGERRTGADRADRADAKNVAAADDRFLLICHGAPPVHWRHWPVSKREGFRSVFRNSASSRHDRPAEPDVLRPARKGTRTLDERTWTNLP